MKQTMTAKALLIAFLMFSGNVRAETFPVVPENLKIPVTEVLSLEAQGNGVQIYECQASVNDATRFEWVFKAPDADLFDSRGVKIGKHYAGPTWESEDGSKVVGKVKAQDNSSDPGSIPWLLLSAKSTSGHGVFSRIKNIQRLNTIGGKPPASECIPAMAGKEIRVPYKATYYFYVEAP